MKRLLSLPALLCCLIATAQPPTYREPYRPQFHFSPAINWTNDPNGLVYYKGEYHLFYQYNPFDKVWGHMTWAHAVSRDLLHWQHLPIAIPEENGIMIFSGTCVADTANTSGFGVQKDAPPMVAIYTGHTDTNQSQHLAYSLDKGRTWTKYAGNPILDIHKKDFRDPKVFWYAPKKYWVMALVLPDEHKVQLYSSKNLKSWTHLSDFGPAGDVSSIWECPDLSLVPVEGEPGKKKWVLLNSVQNDMQYFVGSFDGVSFTNENPPAVLRPDYGPDYYAAIAYNQLPASQPPTTIGWANNWSYAKDIPTTPWRSAMSLPRTLSVKKFNDTWVLLQKPLPGLQSLRKPILVNQNNNELLGGAKPLAVQSQQLELDLLIAPGASAVTGVRLAAGNGHELEIGYDATRNVLYLDRSKTANQSFNKEFEARKRFETALPLKNNQLRLHIFFDHSIVEVFANEGEAVMTAQVFPREADDGIELFSNGGNSRINSLKIWQLNSAW
jgi:fructan beta-fructosidase